MKILITAEGQYTVESKDAPKTGFYYTLEDATKGTNAQNKTFHALVTVYWKSGVHPKYGGCGYHQFRDIIKRDLGVGFEAFVYASIVDGKPRINQVSSIDEIPEEIRLDPEMRTMIQGKLKSWGRYTKKERIRTIDNLIDDMAANGVNSDDFMEILKGLEFGKHRNT